MTSAALIVVAAYLLGSVSFAVVVSKAFDLPDPHEYGSGNPGATNVLRTGNKLAAVLTLVGDGVKGWLAVLLAEMARSALDAPEWVVPGAALAVFLGHLYPVFHQFKGGKGVSTAAGILSTRIAARASPNPAATADVSARNGNPETESPLKPDRSWSCADATAGATEPLTNSRIARANRAVPP